MEDVLRCVVYNIEKLETLMSYWECGKQIIVDPATKIVVCSSEKMR